ncbi:MAG: hypothetical protein WD042_18340 [Phycisphaeraceae bacterium]
MPRKTMQVRHVAVVAMALLMGGVARPIAAADDLPAKGSTDKPLIVLEAEPDPPASADDTIQVHGGKVVAQEGTDYVKARKSDVVAAHKGFGKWSVTFGYQLAAAPAAGSYDFHVRWHQGGDPEATVQTFKVLAGPTVDKLEERGTFKLKNSTPWKFQWVKASKRVTLKADDIVIQVQNAGSAHDAKVFDAFVLAPVKE